MIRNWPAIVVPLLVVLLTWLSVRAINSGAERYDGVLSQIDQFSEAGARLKSHVLSARAGILRNYDPLVADELALEQKLAALDATAGRDPDTRAAIARLGASLNRTEDLVERFKSENALLQNSLSYFARFSGDLSAANGPVDAAVSATSGAMLRFTLDSTPATAKDVKDRLDRLAAARPQGDGADTVGALLAHGRLLYHTLPAADGLVRGIVDMPLREQEEALRAVVVRHQIASREIARRYRVTLYVVSLLLVIVLIHLSLRLRNRAYELRRRAALEHAIANMSVRFLDARSEDVERVVEEAIAALGLCVDSDRAYFVRTGPSSRKFSWCRRGFAFHEGWPERAATMVERFPPVTERIVQINDVSRLAAGADRDLLAGANIRGWACAFTDERDGGRVLLGFETAGGPCRITRPGELSLLRTALDSISNVLDRARLEQERLDLEERLQQARRMEAMGAMASGVAHNFNNIIGAILGYTEMAREHQDSPRRLATLVSQIQTAGERARELVERILAFARRRGAHRSQVNMRDLIAECGALLKASLPQDVRLTVGEVPSAAVVTAEPTMLQQVILNLCTNAAQAGASEIEIVTAIDDAPQARSLSVGRLAPGRYVCVVVSDNGGGMDASTLERIFEPFFTTKSGGSGLGLATVREIVREHDGAIAVHSAPGTGTTFEIWLACVTNPTPADTANAPSLPFGRGETVLIVDVDMVQLLREEELLAALGYEPVGFRSAQEALKAIREAPQRFDAVIIGAIPCLEFTTELRSISPDIPLMLALPANSGFRAGELADRGVCEILSWPLVATEVAVALKRCWQHQAVPPVEFSQREPSLQQ